MKFISRHFLLILSPLQKEFFFFFKNKVFLYYILFFSKFYGKIEAPISFDFNLKIWIVDFSSFHSWKNTTKQLFLSENNYFLPCRGEKRWVISFITLRILLYVCHTWEKILAVGILPSYILKNAGWHRQEMQ